MIHEDGHARLMGLVKEAGVALVGFVYEATHLSPMKPNGDHDCTIKAETLAQARATLAKIKEATDAE